jgi:hypothetical protein
MQNRLGIVFSAACGLLIALTGCDEGSGDEGGADDGSGASAGGSKADEPDDETGDDTGDGACEAIDVSDDFGLLECHSTEGCHVAAAGEADVVCATGEVESCESINLNSPEGVDPQCEERPDCVIQEVMSFDFPKLLCRSVDARCELIDPNDPNQFSTCIDAPECFPVSVDGPNQVCRPGEPGQGGGG